MNCTWCVVSYCGLNDQVYLLDPSWLFHFVSSICERQLPFTQIPICLQTVNSEIPEALHDPESSFERQNKVNDRHTSKFESSKRNSRQKFHFKQIRDWHHKSPEDKTSEVDNHKARIINTKWLFFRISQGFMFERSKEKKRKNYSFCDVLFYFNCGCVSLPLNSLMTVFISLFLKGIVIYTEINSPSE